MTSRTHPAPAAPSLVLAALNAALDALMPPRCTSCKAPVSTAGLYCADCWGALQPPASPCHTCGVPLPPQWSAEATCLGCLAAPPDFSRARAPFVYADVARSTVLAFKNGAEHLAPLMARAMHLAARDLAPPDGQLGECRIVPVPLHRWRLLRRGYNQSALLAGALAPLTGGTLDLDSLVRRHATDSTRGKGRAARQAQMKGAFSVRADRRSAIRGQHILLVDDVLTTGATASAAARALRRAGALSVVVITYARVAGDTAPAYAQAMGGLAVTRGQHGKD